MGMGEIDFTFASNLPNLDGGKAESSSSVRSPNFTGLTCSLEIKTTTVSWLSFASGWTKITGEPGLR